MCESTATCTLRNLHRHEFQQGSDGFRSLLPVFPPSSAEIMVADRQCSQETNSFESKLPFRSVE